MSEQSKPHLTHHDRIFKEFLYRFLPDFLRLFFPNEAAQLNFDTLKFLDKDLIVNLPEQALRITDIIAEVERLTGEKEVIITHVDVEARRKKPLPRRMFEYYALLRLLSQKRVLPIALVLLPNAGGLTWQMYTETLFDRELVQFQYGQVGVRDLFSKVYLEKGDPVAAALTALMKPGDEDPVSLKLTARQTIADSGLTAGR
ncbi:MAG: hypothetical protein GY796_27350 [Chloroflexi bacterium]|nr:hypothetical protein [Chloroflexota bacterium]